MKEHLSGSFNQFNEEDSLVRESVVTPQNFNTKFLEITEKEVFINNNSLVLKSKLANIFSNTYSSYRENNSSAIKLLHDFELIEKDFLSLLPIDIDDNVDINKHLKKRTPTLIEAIKGTLIRFDKLEKIQEVFNNNTEGVILGGSMSYGSFLI